MSAKKDNKKVKPEAKTEPKKSTGRKCSICTNAEVKKINSLINERKSFRDISRQISGDEKMKDALWRHTENCLKLEISALIKEKKIENAIDHYAEIGEQLKFAKKLRLAAEEYLSDPENPDKLILLPRADEIEIVYFDHNDKVMGESKRKRAKLDAILEEIFIKGAKQADKWSIKHVDLRSFALDSVKTTGSVLDMIFKLEGLYQKDRENSDELSQLKKQIEKRAEQKGVSYDEEVKNYLKLFGAEIKPEIKQELSSNLVQ